MESLKFMVFFSASHLFSIANASLGDFKGVGTDLKSVPLTPPMPRELASPNEGISQQISKNYEQFSSQQMHTESNHHELSSYIQETAKNHDLVNNNESFDQSRRSSQSFSHIDRNSTFSEQSSSYGKTEHSENSAASQSNSLATFDGDTKHSKSTEISHAAQSITADGYMDKTESSAKAVQTTNNNSNGTAQTTTSAAVQAEITSIIDGKTENSTTKAATVAKITKTSDEEEHKEVTAAGQSEVSKTTDGHTKTVQAATVAHSGLITHADGHTERSDELTGTVLSPKVSENASNQNYSNYPMAGTGNSDKVMNKDKEIEQTVINSTDDKQTDTTNALSAAKAMVSRREETNNSKKITNGKETTNNENTFNSEETTNTEETTNRQETNKDTKKGNKITSSEETQHAKKVLTQNSTVEPRVDSDQGEEIQANNSDDVMTSDDKETKPTNLVPQNAKNQSNTSDVTNRFQNKNRETTSGFIKQQSSGKNMHKVISTGNEKADLTVTQAGSTNSQRSTTTGSETNKLTESKFSSTNVQRDITTENKKTNRTAESDPISTQVITDDEGNEKQSVNTNEYESNESSESSESEEIDETSSLKTQTSQSDSKFESFQSNLQADLSKKQNTKGRYDLSPLDGEKAIHHAIQMDMNYKTLIVKDGNDEKCFCSCGLNSIPVFMEINSKSIQ